MRFQKYSFFAAVALGAFALIGGTGLTVSSGWLITMASQHPPVLVLSVAIVMVRFFGIFRSVARYGERVISHQSIFRSLTSIREKLFTAVAQNLRSLNISRVGKSIVDDVERVQELALRTTLPGASAAIAGVFTLLVTAWTEPVLLIWITPAVLYFTFLIPLFVHQFLDPLSKEIEDRENVFGEISADSAYGALEAEVFGYLDAYRSEIEDESRALHHLERRFLRRSAAIQTSILLLLGSLLVFTGQHFTTTRDLVPVKVAMALFLILVGFEGYTSWFPNLFIAGKNRRAAENLQSLSGISIPNVKEYQASSNPVLHAVALSPYWDEVFLSPVSFELKRGETLLLTGPSGAGKSTVASALFGFCRYEGSLSVDGVELSTITSLERLISGTLQSGYIFNTTVRENLLIGSPGSDDSKLHHILTVMELGELPLDEVIGDFGRKLSGGEAKRLSIARALLSDSPFLLLDEPLEHLDDELALRIEDAIYRESEGRGVIVISHAPWRQYSKKVEVERE